MQIKHRIRVGSANRPTAPRSVHRLTQSQRDSIARAASLEATSVAPTRQGWQSAPIGVALARPGSTPVETTSRGEVPAWWSDGPTASFLSTSVGIAGMSIIAMAFAGPVRGAVVGAVMTMAAAAVRFGSMSGAAASKEPPVIAPPSAESQAQWVADLSEPSQERALQAAVGLGHCDTAEPALLGVAAKESPFAPELQRACGAALAKNLVATGAPRPRNVRQPWPQCPRRSVDLLEKPATVLG